MHELKDTRRYLPQLPAMLKDGMKRPRSGLRNTRKSELEETTEEALAFEEYIHSQRENENPEGDHSTSNVFRFAALLDKEMAPCTLMQ